MIFGRRAYWRENVLSPPHVPFGHRADVSRSREDRMERLMALHRRHAWDEYEGDRADEADPRAGARRGSLSLPLAVLTERCARCPYVQRRWCRQFTAREGCMCRRSPGFAPAWMASSAKPDAISSRVGRRVFSTVVCAAQKNSLAFSI